MKIEQFNPSPLEIEFEEALLKISEHLKAAMPQYTFDSLRSLGAKDNPDILASITDKDGDKHEVIIKIIHRPDYY